MVYVSSTVSVKTLQVSRNTSILITTVSWHKNIFDRYCSLQIHLIEFPIRHFSARNVILALNFGTSTTPVQASESPSPVPWLPVCSFVSLTLVPPEPAPLYHCSHQPTHQWNCWREHGKTIWSYQFSPLILWIFTLLSKTFNMLCIPTLWLPPQHPPRLS